MVMARSGYPDLVFGSGPPVVGFAGSVGLAGGCVAAGFAGSVGLAAGAVGAAAVGLDAGAAAG